MGAPVGEARLPDKSRFRKPIRAGGPVFDASLFHPAFDWLRGCAFSTSESGVAVGCVESSERTGWRFNGPATVRSEDSTHPTLQTRT